MAGVKAASGPAAGSSSAISAEGLRARYRANAAATPGPERAAELLSAPGRRTAPDGARIAQPVQAPGI